MEAVKELKNEVGFTTFSSFCRSRKVSGYTTLLDEASARTMENQHQSAAPPNQIIGDVAAEALT